jgi:hypothetical protein
MSGAEEPDGREHEGDEYVTYSRRKEEGTDLTFRLSLPVQRKRKRHLEKQNDEQSARLSAKQRRGLVTGMSDQRAAVRPQQIQT